MHWTDYKTLLRFLGQVDGRWLLLLLSDGLRVSISFVSGRGTCSRYRPSVSGDDLRYRFRMEFGFEGVLNVVHLSRLLVAVWLSFCSNSFTESIKLL